MEFKYEKKRLTINHVLSSGLELVDTVVTVKGWIKNYREFLSKQSLIFIELNDGSCFNNIQIILTDDNTYELKEILNNLFVGTSCSFTGEIVKSPAKGQLIELKTTSYKIYGGIPSEPKYPFQKNQRSTLEYNRQYQHLRARTNLHAASMRVRNAMTHAIHSFFSERGFLNIHTPLITTSDCEGAGEMFSVSTLLSSNPKGELSKNENGLIDYSKDFFNKPAYLTVSGQLNAETHACALSDVYTFGPTFRAENSNTTRHLSEFWMVEPEIAFADLNDNMDFAEDMLKYCTNYALENCKEDLEFFNKQIEKGLIERLQNTIESDFVRITYTEAIELLSKTKKKFSVKPVWGIDLGTEHERYIVEKIYNKPVCIYNYPKDIKAVYMRINDDNTTVAAVDIIVPKIGEIIGGSQREERYDILYNRLLESGHDMESYDWYLDLRRFGTVPHSGFGLGFERLIRYITGIENIRDVIPFPRYPGNANY
jgi:asparaginyl-tRNA synthetase